LVSAALSWLRVVCCERDHVVERSERAASAVTATAAPERRTVGGSYRGDHLSAREVDDQPARLERDWVLTGVLTLARTVVA